MQNFLLFLLSFCWVLLTLPAFAQNITIDIFGANGLHPQDGECCVYLPRSRNPRDGDDAVRGTPGKNANNLDLELQDNGQALNGHVVVYGTVYGSNSRQALSQIDRTMNLNASIFINAYGGQGARGGNGGQGQDGCNGADGRDATSSSNGTDGDDGCNSGSGGDAAPAQPGGDGGRVRVYIPANQTHLALLVSANVDSGNGGASGRPGQPGSPGRGGDGGDSHRYISRYEDEPACPSSPSGGGGFNGGGGGIRDLGNGYDSFESNLSPNLLDFMKDTGRVAGDIVNGLIGVSPAYACGGRRAVYDTNPGGSDGSNGRSGSMGGGITSPGRNGEDGQLEFIVVNPNGSETSYARPFNLKLLSYDISDAAPGGNGDGIFEPNETLTISNLRVINDSAMPSPRMADVILSLQTSNWLLANPIDQVVIPPLPGRSQVLLDKVFTVKIKNSFSVGQNQSWSVSDTLVPVGLFLEYNEPKRVFSCQKQCTSVFL
jgi:hypothetical protein